MTKKAPIRKDDVAMCDRSILLRWLYGQPSRPDEGVLHAQTLSCCPHLVHVAGQTAGTDGVAEKETDEKDIGAVSTVSNPMVANPMANVLVLELGPWSRANKANKARDSHVWNTLYGLVKSASVF